MKEYERIMVIGNLTGRHLVPVKNTSNYNATIPCALPVWLLKYFFTCAS